MFFKKKRRKEGKKERKEGVRKDTESMREGQMRLTQTF